MGEKVVNEPWQLQVFMRALLVMMYSDIVGFVTDLINASRIW